MTERTTLASRRRMAIMSIALVALAGMLTWTYVGAQRSSAAFSDAEQFGLNRLGAGTVEIAVGERGTVFDVANMAPGDRATGSLDIANRGTFPLRFVASGSSTGGPLVDVLEVVAWPTSGECGSAPSRGTDVWLPLRDSSPSTIEGPNGARRGRVAPGQSVKMCFAAELSVDAPNSAQRQQLEFGVSILAEHDIAASEAEARSK